VQHRPNRESPQQNRLRVSVTDALAVGVLIACTAVVIVIVNRH
jgi:hypothetical protein